MDRLPFDFMNAAGWAKTRTQVRKLAEVPLLTHIVIGSFTVEPRSERGGGTDFDVLDDGTASNNRGLPNSGLRFLEIMGPAMANIAHDAGKKFVVSGAPFSPKEDALLAMAACAIGADAYESNRGCPNTDADIISYNHELMAECDRAVDQAIGMRLPWRRKVSPYTNPKDRNIEAELTRSCSACGIVACNTLPRARLRRNGEPIITAKDTNGLGGLSGTGIKHLSLANAEHFSELFVEAGVKSDVIGSGGIGSWRDVDDYLMAGCSGVQVGAAFFKNEDPRVLQRIVEDWLLHGIG